MDGNNCAVACNSQAYLLLTHSISPIVIAGLFILIYDFLRSIPRGLSSTTMSRPS